MFFYISLNLASLMNSLQLLEGVDVGVVMVNLLLYGVRYKNVTLSYCAMNQAERLCVYTSASDIWSVRTSNFK
jgi:hypothetical protein